MLGFVNANAHVFDITNGGTHHELKLAKPVCCFVISGNNDVAVIVHDRLDTGLDIKTIHILGKLSEVLATKHGGQTSIQPQSIIR